MRSCEPERAKNITAQLKSEALTVVSKLLAPPKLAVERLDANQILMIGAEGDRIIPASEVRGSAAFINARFKSYQGRSHTFQAEREWPVVAKDLLLFLRGLSSKQLMTDAHSGRKANILVQQ